MQLKQYEIVTDADKLQVDIHKVCMEHKTIKQWAYILHDKDNTRPHYHIYINFGNAGIPHDMVARWFCVEENFVEKVKGKKSDVLLYLIHGNSSQQDKHQYEPSEVISNFDWKVEIENAKILGAFDKFSYAQQLCYVNSLSNDEKIPAYNKLKKLWELYCQTVLLNADRQVEVMFISGRGGSGKTYYAKKLLTNMGFDFCISSASNDPFQDYLGQKAIILDDLRDTSFELEDLLKLLDNNTNSSVKSRFNNKVFNGDVIVITSVVPLNYWYLFRRCSYQGVDSLTQLYRRIGTYVEITETTIKVYKNIDATGRPTGKCVTFKNGIVKLKKEKHESVDFVKVFSEICEASED